MEYFWIVWTIDFIILVIALYFFFTGISTASPGSKFFPTWFKLLGVLVAIVVGSYWLHGHGYPAWASRMASFPAFLGMGYVLFMLMLIILNPRWN